MRFSIGSHKWTRLLFWSVVLYLGFLPLWWIALPVLTSIVGAAAHLIYSAIDSRVSISSTGHIVTVVVNGAGGQASSSGVRLDTVTYGFPMLAALVAVTSSASFIAKMQALVIGWSVMITLTLLSVILWAKISTLRVDEIVTQSGNRSSFFYYAFHGYAFSQPVVAIVLWIGMIMLGVFSHRGKRAAAASSASTPRNAACPCGSGRKYKKCCGLAAQR